MALGHGAEGALAGREDLAVGVHQYLAHARGRAPRRPRCRARRRGHQAPTRGQPRERLRGAPSGDVGKRGGPRCAERRITAPSVRRRAGDSSWRLAVRAAALRSATAAASWMSDSVNGPAGRGVIEDFGETPRRSRELARRAGDEARWRGRRGRPWRRPAAVDRGPSPSDTAASMSAASAIPVFSMWRYLRSTANWSRRFQMKPARRPCTDEGVFLMRAPPWPGPEGVHGLRRRPRPGPASPTAVRVRGLQEAQAGEALAVGPGRGRCRRCAGWRRRSRRTASARHSHRGSTPSPAAPA